MPYITDTNRARARVFDRKKLHELLNGDILCLFPPFVVAEFIDSREDSFNFN